MKKTLLALSLSISALFAFGQTVEVSTGIDNASVKTTVEKNATELLSALSESATTGKYKAPSKKAITPDASAYAKGLIDNSLTISQKDKLSIPCTRFGNYGYQMRGIPAKFASAPEGSQDKALVINFDNNGKISEVLLAIDNASHKDILSESDDMEDTANRLALINIIERLNTAYTAKDIKLIETLINAEGPIHINDGVKYQPTGKKNTQIANKQAKQRYLNNLEHMLKKAKYVDAGFGDIQVTKSAINNQCYGLKIKQNLTTEKYNEEGYLLLIVEFDDAHNPSIVGIKWLPEFINGSEPNINDIIQLEIIYL